MGEVGGGGGTVVSKSYEVISGITRVQETVTVTVMTGGDAYTFTMGSDGLDVSASPSEMAEIDVTGVGPISGKKPGVSGSIGATSYTWAGGVKSTSAWTFDDGYVGRTYDTSWTVTQNGGAHGDWSATIDITGTVGVRPSEQEIRIHWSRVPVIPPVPAKDLAPEPDSALCHLLYFLCGQPLPAKLPRLVQAVTLGGVAAWVLANPEWGVFFGV
jgi:hypothetical protein